MLRFLIHFSESCLLINFLTASCWVAKFSDNFQRGVANKDFFVCACSLHLLQFSTQPLSSLDCLLIHGSKNWLIMLDIHFRVWYQGGNLYLMTLFIKIVLKSYIEAIKEEVLSGDKKHVKSQLLDLYFCFMLYYKKIQAHLFFSSSVIIWPGRTSSSSSSLFFEIFTKNNVFNDSQFTEVY